MVYFLLECALGICLCKQVVRQTDGEARGQGEFSRGTMRSYWFHYLWAWSLGVLRLISCIVNDTQRWLRSDLPPRTHPNPVVSSLYTTSPFTIIALSRCHHWFKEKHLILLLQSVSINLPLVEPIGCHLCRCDWKGWEAALLNEGGKGFSFVLFFFFLLFVITQQMMRSQSPIHLVRCRCIWPNEWMNEWIWLELSYLVFPLSACPLAIPFPPKSRVHSPLYRCYSLEFRIPKSSNYGSLRNFF